MPTGKLKRSDQSEIAAVIREAIGADGVETITVTKPQFERPASLPPIKAAPSLSTEWNKLCSMTKEQLADLGCCPWDGKLFLFPHEWYPYIPDGFEIIDILGLRERFRRGVTDDDKRFGCLSFGVYAIDGKEELEGGKRGALENIRSGKVTRTWEVKK